MKYYFCGREIKLRKALEFRESEHPRDEKGKFVSVIVSGDGFKNFTEAREYAKENLISFTFINKHTNENIYIGRDAIDKILSSKAVNKSDSVKTHLKAIEKLPEILKESVLEEIHNDKKLNNDVEEIHRYYCNFKIGDEIFKVKTTVRKFKNNIDSKFYTHEVQKMELLENRWYNPEGTWHKSPDPKNSNNSKNSNTNLQKSIPIVKKFWAFGREMKL